MDGSISVVAVPLQEVVKRGRGRPRKLKVEGEESVKRARGRPKKEVIAVEKEDDSVKRGRGRPRKYPVLGKERLPSGEYKPVLKKVESGILLKHMFEYFSKLLVVHQELSREGGNSLEPIFKRLRVLDFQMVEVCKEVLSSEYQRIDPSLANNNVSSVV